MGSHHEIKEDTIFTQTSGFTQTAMTHDQPCSLFNPVQPSEQFEVG